MDRTPIERNLASRIRYQKLDQRARKEPNTFIRNLKDTLDKRRSNQSLALTVPNTWQISDNVDFCSNDILSLGSSGRLREEFLKELAKHPNFSPGSGGSRLLDGSYPYLQETEEIIARYHGAETGLMLNSGYDGNLAIWSAIPRLGDIIVYDALVHASTHEGIRNSLARDCKEFAHNDVDSFKSVLLSILDSQPQVRQKTRCVLVAVESVYSMDGDICPLQDLIDTAYAVFDEQSGVVQFVVDEAHSTGIVGEKGRGVVSELGLEKHVAVRLHTFGKAMCASGAIILACDTVRAVLVNFARSVIFSTAPSFPSVAAIRAGYNILATEEMDQARSNIQHLVRSFFTSVTAHPLWNTAQNLHILRIPLSSDWATRPFQTHIVPIRTVEQYHHWLFFHLTFTGFSVFPVDYPTVPTGQTRLKISLHASNSQEDVDRLVRSLFDFVIDILAIQEGLDWKDEVPQSVKHVYAWMATENLSGYGRP